MINDTTLAQPCRAGRPRPQSWLLQVGRRPADDPSRRTGLRCLQPYSPNLNSIEQAFAKIKHWMRVAQSEPWRRHGNSRLPRLLDPARRMQHYFVKASMLS